MTKTIRTILKTITAIMGVIWIMGVCLLDTEGTIIPTLMCTLPMIWIAPYVYLTERREDK